MASDRVPDPVLQAAPQSHNPDVAASTSPARRNSFIYFGFLIGAALICSIVWIQTTTFGQSQETGNSSKWNEGSSQIVRATVFVAKNQPRILPDPQDQSKESESESERFRQCQVWMVKSRSVLNAALKQRDPEPIAELSIIKEQTDPIRWLENNLQVGFIDKTEFLRIGLSGAPSKERVQLVNAVVRAYLEEFFGKEKTSHDKRLEMLNISFAKVDEEKKRIKNHLEELSKAAGFRDGGNPEQKRQMVSAQITEFTRELPRVRVNKILLQAQIKVKKAGIKADKEGQATISKLEEEAAILSEQEKLIVQEIAVLERIRASTVPLDLEAIHEDLRSKEQTWKNLLLAIDNLKMNATAPARIYLLETAS